MESETSDPKRKGKVLCSEKKQLKAVKTRADRSGVILGEEIERWTPLMQQLELSFWANVEIFHTGKFLQQLQLWNIYFTAITTQYFNCKKKKTDLHKN